MESDASATASVLRPMPVADQLVPGVTIAGAAVFAEQVLQDGVQALVY